MSLCMKEWLKHRTITLLDIDGFLMQGLDVSSLLDAQVAEVHKPNEQWSKCHPIWSQGRNAVKVFKVTNEQIYCDYIPDTGNTTFLYQDIFDLDELLDKIDIIDNKFPETASHGSRLFRIQTSAQLAEFGSDDYDLNLVGADGILVDYNHMVRMLVLRDSKDLSDFNAWFFRHCSNRKLQGLPVGFIGEVQPNDVKRLNIKFKFYTLGDVLSFGLAKIKEPKEQVARGYAQK